MKRNIRIFLIALLCFSTLVIMTNLWAQHAPGAGQTQCHNYDGKDEKGNKVKADCPCWGQYSPDYEKCKPKNEEDKKCRNYCHKDFCKCKVKCQS